MLRKQLAAVALSLGILCLARPAAAGILAPLTSNNSLNVLGYSYGSTPSVFTDWAASLAGNILGEGNGFTSASSFIAGGNFQVTGATISAGSYQGSPLVPMVLTMPSLTTFTGLAVQFTGDLTVTLKLSDGSTVTTGELNLASPTNVVFTSPLQIISAEINSLSGGSFLFSDVVWGTADPSKLPAQPQQGQGTGDTGDTSPVPETSGLWLMGGGLLGISQLAKKRRHLLRF